jgi:hypothetical protein
MSLIKELKSNPENQINMVDILQILTKQEKTKYVDLLLRMVKKTKNIERYVDDIKNTLRVELGIEPERLENYSPLQLVMLYRIVESTFNYSDLKNYQKFIEYNERGLIPQNDLTQFKTFDDVLNATSLAEVKSYEKDLEKQINIVFKNDEWVVIRPLTYHSSLKYGSSTKWCTSSENNPEYFLRYSKRGILLFMINKINGYKVACFKSLDDDKEFSFWNQQDTRIDSIEADLPDFIMNEIRNEVKKNITNFSLLSDEDKKKQESLLDRLNGKMSSIEEREDVEEPVRDEPMVDETINGYEYDTDMEMSEPETEQTPMNEAMMGGVSESFGRLLR